MVVAVQRAIACTMVGHASRGAYGASYQSLPQSPVVPRMRDPALSTHVEELYVCFSRIALASLLFS